MTTTQALAAFLTPLRLRELGRETDFLARAAVSRLQLPPGGYARGGEAMITTYAWGEGPTALVVHGWGSRAAHLEALIQRLVTAGRRVVSFDAPGHGRSDGDLSSAPAFAAAIRQLAAWQDGVFESVIAHSLGALAVALALGNDWLKTRRVVTLGACRRVEPVLAKFAAAADLDEETRAELTRMATIEFPPEETEADRYAPRFAGVPALLLHDPADVEMPYSHSQMLAAAWPGAVLEDTPGVGHFRILRSKEVAKRATEFALA